MIRTIEMPILHREIAEFLDPRIHEAAPGAPSFALHGFRIDDREYLMDCLPTVGLMVGYRIVETCELVSALQCDKGVSEKKTDFPCVAVCTVCEISGDEELRVFPA